MKVLSALLVLVLAVGIYSDCGCLKCNKQLNVLSPRGSGLKIIYKNQPCGCLTSVPYSVQVPVQPATSGNQRCYGYQIQEPQVVENAAVACPIPQEYNVQLQIPRSQPAPSYLVGLVAKTDRILISGPSEPLPAPGCPRPQLEPLQVVQDTDGDISDWYYGNSQFGCGCLRYDRKIPKFRLIRPQKVSNSPLQLLQRHSYSPPNPRRVIMPGIIRIYRQCFCQPRQNKSPYQQVFIKAHPKLFWVNPDLNRRILRNSELPSRKSQNRLKFFTPNQQNIIEGQKNLRNMWKDSNLEDRPNSDKFLNSLPRQKVQELNSNPLKSKNVDENLPNDVHPGIIQLRNSFAENIIDSEPGSQNFGRKLGYQNVESENFKPKQNLKNFDNNPETFGPRQKLSIEPMSVISRNAGDMDNFPDYNAKLDADFSNKQSEEPQTLTTKRYYKKLDQDSVQNQPETSSNRNQAHKSNNSVPILQNLHPHLPKNFHMTKSQQLLVTEDKSGPKTMFLSTTQQLSSISDSLLAETFDSSMSKNRAKRSINMKLLALKPENPPRFLRMHNPGQRSFQNYKNEEETISTRRSPLGRRNFGHGAKSSNHGMNPSVYGYNGRHSGHGINPSVYGHIGRHAGHGLNPSVHGHTGRYSGHGPTHSGYGQVGLSSLHSGRHCNHGRKPLFGNEKLSRFPRENKRKKKKVQPKKKKNNAILKSAWKRTGKIIKNWFTKSSPLSAPEIQLPSFESSKMKKHFPRYKRRIRDEGLLPYLKFPEEKRKLGKRKPTREDKNVQKAPEPKPEEAFLKPLNFDHIFHPTPILHLLNTPIRCLSQFHKLKSHVSPVVGTIPKVIQVSRRYVVGLLKNFGKNAIHLGSHFLKGFTSLKKSNILPKRRHRRSLDPSSAKIAKREAESFGREVGEGDGKKTFEDKDWGNINFQTYGGLEETGSAWKEYKDSDGKEWAEEDVVVEQAPINLEDANEKAEDATADEELSRFMGQPEGEYDNLDQKASEQDQVDIASFFNRRRKRNVEEDNDEKTKVDNPPANENIFAGLLRLLLGLGHLQGKQEVKEDPNHQNEHNFNDEDSDENSKFKERQKGDVGGDDSDQYQNIDQNNSGLKPKIILLNSDSDLEPKERNVQDEGYPNTMTAIVERRKRGIDDIDIEEVLGELENSGIDLKRFDTLWELAGTEKALDHNPNLIKKEMDTGMISRRKREAESKKEQKVPSEEMNQNLSTDKITKETKPVLPQHRSKPSELDVQVQTIKDKIAQISTNIQTLKNYDVSQTLDVYQGLLKLQHIKTVIVQKSKAINNEHKPEDITAKKKELAIELKEAQDLKALIFQELLQRINNHNGIFKANLIKILIRLQKLHCVVKNLNQKLEDQDSKIKFLEDLDLVKSNNQKGILASLKHDRDINLKAQIELGENLKKILDKADGEKIKEEAKIIWEINNIEKLQNVSILELNQKISQGQKIRKELKILFDLQKQLENCEEKQTILGNNPVVVGETNLE